MNIARISMGLSQANLQNAYGVAMLKKTMDVNEQMGESTINMMNSMNLANKQSMELSVNPNIGSQLDLFV